jgi:hypothetical protein
MAPRGPRCLVSARITIIIIIKPKIKARRFILLPG